ncbi:hypothetical protein R3P38DRAFT_3593217 [Favolaschia claudopus]|uniref:Uncharacterized protein n=1 Tax=Favolaschia claudopus TaxID=2862362 RepID=A0AAW0AHU9_9AGAR
MNPRPTRTHRAPLNPALAVVPVSLRSRHPEFQHHAVNTSNSDMAQAPELQRQRQEERPFPSFQSAAGTPAPRAFPAVPTLGERFELPSLRSATKQDFDEALAEFKKLSGAEFVPPPKPPTLSTARNSDIIIDVDDICPPSPRGGNEEGDTLSLFFPQYTLGKEEDQVSVIPIPSPPVTAPLSDLPLPALLFANFRNESTGSAKAFSIKATLPYPPFASTIIAALWSRSRVLDFTGKWPTNRISVAYSRKPTSIMDTEYNGRLSGYTELGSYEAVFGSFPDVGFGGTGDQIVPPIIVATEEEERVLGHARQLHDLPPTARAYSMFFFREYTTVAAPPVPAPSAIKADTADDSDCESDTPQVVIRPAKNPATTKPVTPGAAYLERTLPTLITHFRAIDSSTLGLGYKTHASVRIVRDIAARIGMLWPKKSGLPKSITTSRGITVSLDDILSLLDDPPALGTFGNHNTQHNLLLQAKHLLAKKLEANTITNEEALRGSLFFYILEAPLLEPVGPDFVPPSDFEDAVKISAASLRQQANDIVNPPK